MISVCRLHTSLILARVLTSIFNIQKWGINPPWLHSCNICTSNDFTLNLIHCRYYARGNIHAHKKHYEVCSLHHHAYLVCVSWTHLVWCWHSASTAVKTAEVEAGVAEAVHSACKRIRNVVGCRLRFEVQNVSRSTHLRLKACCTK